MEPLNNPVVLLFAAFLPLLVAFVKQSGWKESTNSLIAFACYVVVGIVGAIATAGTPTPETFGQWIVVVTLIGRATYSMVWSKLGGAGEDSVDSRITEATSIVR